MPITAASTEWVSYWDQLPEGQLLFHPEAEEYVRNLLAAVPVTASMRVLDFGCGYGFVAELLSPRVGEVWLWDAAEGMRRWAAERLASCPNVKRIDLATTTDVRFDLILVNSVVQYMSPDEFVWWLGRWRGLLAPGGKVVISDLSDPNHRSLSDVLSLLSFSLRRGYFFQAIRNVLRERKRYQQTVNACPLLRVGREELTRLAAEASLSVRFLPCNLTHFRGRYAVILEAA